MIVDEIKAIQKHASRRPRHGYPAKAAPFSWPTWREGRPQWKLIDYQAYVEEGFNLNSLVYESIMYKARALQQVLLRAYKGSTEHPELLDADHPLAKLVARPNPHQSFVEFQSQSIVYLNLSGNNYLLMDRPKSGGLPEAMYSLRPDRVFVIPGKQKRGQTGLRGYLYVPEGKSAWSGWDARRRVDALREGEAIPIVPQDIMHTKLPNPGDPLEGLGDGLPPLSPSARSVDVDNKVTHFLKLFFDKGVIVPGLLQFESPLTDPIMSRVRERWKEIYGGYESWAEEIGILDQGGSYQRIGLTFEEMGFGQLDERNESRVLGPFGIPPILVGTRIGLAHATYSNYQIARLACWEDTLVPEVMLFEVDYQYYLQGDDGEFVAYDYSKVPAFREIRNAAWERASGGVNGGWVTVNEGRAEAGLPAVEGGDVFLRGVTVIPEPVETQEFAEPTTERTEEGAAEAEADERKAWQQIKAGDNGSDGQTKATIPNGLRSPSVGLGEGVRQGDREGDVGQQASVAEVAAGSQVVQS